MEVVDDDNKPSTFCGFTINGYGYTVEPIPGRKNLALIRSEPGKGHIVGYVREGEAQILKTFLTDIVDFVSSGKGYLHLVGLGSKE